MSTATPDTPESWGAASRGYAERVAPYLMSSFIDEHLDRLSPAADAIALEVGAGSGALTERLAGRVGSLLATDFAPDMIEVLQERMTAAGVSGVEYAVMDGQALDLPDDRFDVAASSFAVMLFPDRAKGFSELSRVLRPGGRAAVTAWAGPDKFEAFGLFLAGLQRAFPDMPPAPAPPPVFSLADLGAFKAEMEAGGFASVETDYISRELTIQSFDDMWGMLTAGAPPVQMLFDRVGPEGREKLEGALREIVDERFGGGPISINNVATIGVGVAS